MSGCVDVHVCLVEEMKVECSVALCSQPSWNKKLSGYLRLGRDNWNIQISEVQINEIVLYSVYFCLIWVDDC